MTRVLRAGGLCPPGPPRPGWVALHGGRVVDLGTGRPPRGADDLGAVVLAPGLVDLQVNGVGAIDLATADPDGWHAAGTTLARHGVAAYCPTLVSAPLDAYAPALERIGAAREATGPAAAAILGAHLEGPFLGGAPGAHDPAHVRSADPEWLAALLDAAAHPVALVTLAPEADPGLRATALLTGRGVVVALGHTTAGYDEVRAAVAAGATMATHLFNAMSPLHHRAPGLVGAVLEGRDLTPTLVADLVHVHPAVVRLAFAASASLCLVSDAVGIAPGAPDGTSATVDEVVARRPDGTLVGSRLTLDRAVANVAALGVPVERAVGAATSAPAAALGLSDRGRVAPGARADLVALDPGTLAVRGVWLGGERVLG